MDTSNHYYTRIEGVNIPKFFSEECFRSALQFKPKPNDIIIVTYPKCGTTWMQNLVLNILRKGKLLDKPSDFYLASPFLDQLGAEDSEKMMIHPGCYKSHLPLHKADIAFLSIKIIKTTVLYLLERVNINVALFSYMMAFGNGPRNFEPWSSDVDDT
ncbi:sulfotransferase 1C2A [Trichonephila clavipes]|nr:sulfotransferase 1C2A [Trichonephila clavipes]